MDDLEVINDIEESQLSKLQDLDERKLDQSINKLKRVLKKSSDGDNILLIEGAFLHILHLNQAVAQDITD